MSYTISEVKITNNIYLHIYDSNFRHDGQVKQRVGIDPQEVDGSRGVRR